MKAINLVMLYLLFICSCDISSSNKNTNTSTIINKCKDDNFRTLIQKKRTEKIISSDIENIEKFYGFRSLKLNIELDSCLLVGENITIKKDYLGHKDLVLVRLDKLNLFDTDFLEDDANVFLYFYKKKMFKIKINYLGSYFCNVYNTLSSAFGKANNFNNVKLYKDTSLLKFQKSFYYNYYDALQEKSEFNKYYPIRNNTAIWKTNNITVEYKDFKKSEIIEIPINGRFGKYMLEKKIEHDLVFHEFDFNKVEGDSYFEIDNYVQNYISIFLNNENRIYETLKKEIELKKLEKKETLKIKENLENINGL